VQLEPEANGLLAAFHNAADAVIWVLEVQALMLHTARCARPGPEPYFRHCKDPLHSCTLAYCCRKITMQHGMLQGCRVKVSTPSLCSATNKQ
jgi:hypothetical protein